MACHAINQCKQFHSIMNTEDVAKMRAEQRRQRLMGKDKQRMAKIYNTTEEKVQMPEEYYRH